VEYNQFISIIIGAILLSAFLFARNLSKYSNEKYLENHFRIHYPDKNNGHINEARMRLFLLIMWMFNLIGMTVALTLTLVYDQSVPI